MANKAKFPEDLWSTVITSSFEGNIVIILQLLKHILHDPAPETTSDPESALFKCLCMSYHESSEHGGLFSASNTVYSLCERPQRDVEFIGSSCVSVISGADLHQ